MKIVITSLLMSIGLLSINITVGVFSNESFIISNAQAEPVRRRAVRKPVYRRAYPLGAAAVARETRRRRITRTAVFISVLPRGCTTTYVNNMALQQCGGTYYQSYSGSYYVVNVN